jgi:Acetyl-CoA dehydrogenase C-terminal like
LVAQNALQQSTDHDFYQGKLAAAKYFEKWELPKLGPMLQLLAELEDTPLTMQDSWF